MIQQNDEIPSTVRASDARRLRFYELALVLAVAFALPIFSSAYLLFHNEPRSSIHGDTHILSVLSVMISEATGLAVFFYVLFRQGRSVREFGFRWSAEKVPMTAGVAILLAIAAVSASLLGRVCLNLTYFIATGHHLNWHAEKLPVIAVSLIAILFMVLNGAFEELVVRAYTITEMECVDQKHQLGELPSACCFKRPITFIRARRKRFLMCHCFWFSRFTTCTRATSHRSSWRIFSSTWFRCSPCNIIIKFPNGVLETCVPNLNAAKPKTTF